MYLIWKMMHIKNSQFLGKSGEKFKIYWNRKSVKHKNRKFLKVHTLMIWWVPPNSFKNSFLLFSCFAGEVERARSKGMDFLVVLCLISQWFNGIDVNFSDFWESLTEKKSFVGIWQRILMRNSDFVTFSGIFKVFERSKTVPVQDQRTLKSWKRGDSLKILFKGRFKTFWPKLDLHRAIFDTFPNVWKFLIIHDSWIMSKYCLKFFLKSFHVLIESLPIEWFLNHKNDYFIKKSIK